MITELVSRLPEVYQPVLGHPELSTAVSRGCADRLTHIAAIYRALEALLKRPLRVLDLGCAQGFFSLSLAEMGATVLGVDYLAANVALCQALADEQPTLAARFETARLEAVLARLEPGEFDLVLGLSVLHHVVHESGLAAVQQMLGGLATKVAAGVFELALASEPLYWGPAQAENPRHLLAGFAFVHELARHSTHLSEISRPLYVASSHYWFLSGQAGAFARWESDSHRLAPGAHQGSRRYFFGEQRIVKTYALTHATRGALNAQEYRREAAFLQSPPPGFAAPALVLHGENADEAWLVREELPGELLVDRIAEGRAYDAHRVLREVLTQLAALEAADLFHNDVRTWNVLIGPQGDARLIDYGAISETRGQTPADCMWPHDIFLAFFIFADEVTHARMGGADLLRTAAISPYRLPPPYRQWGLAFWATPANQWSFRLMVQLFVRLDDLPENPALTEKLPLGRWMRAIEEGTDVQTWFARTLQGQQSRFEQQSEYRAMQFQAGQEQLADGQGRLQEEQGRLVDDQGRLLVEQGRLADGLGRLLVEQGRLEDGQGRLLVEQGRLRGEQGRLADSQGLLLEEQGRLADNQGLLLEEQGRLADSQERLLALHEQLRSEWGTAQTHLQGEWAAAQSKIDEFQQLSQQWWSVAEQRNHELQAVYSSQSWRLTQPLRQAVQYFFSAGKTFRDVARSLAVRTLRSLIGNITLQSLLPRALSRHPEARRYAVSLVQRFAALHGPAELKQVIDAKKRPLRILIDLQGAQSNSRFRGIGRYSLSLALAMARNARGHEIWIALNAALPESIPSIRQAFAGWLPPERICVFEAPHPAAEISPANAWRARVAELVHEHFLEQLQPDVVFVSSLFEGFSNSAATSVGQLTPGGKTAVTLYDLIPLLKPEVYLPDDYARDCYYRKIDSLQQAGLLLAISEYSRREAIETLGFAEDRIVTISTAVDERFRPLSLTDEALNTLRKRYGIERKVVMYAPGGFDFRKNFVALIDAYALLAPALRATHQLVIVSKIDGDNVRCYLQKLAEDAGLRQDELVLTGYVPDEDLVALYNLATLFVFPSLHEGFGLPVLEAMACGAPTLGSNTTSIPEVIGLEEALFDPASPTSMAEKMARALSDENWRQKLRAHGLQQAKKFSWDVCAQAAIDAFEARGRRAPHSGRGFAFMPWTLTVDDYRQSCRDLTAAIAALPSSLPAAEVNDRQSLTLTLAKNFKQLDRRLRSTTLPERLTWRIEGPFDSSYSLAVLNRETALALDELGHEVVLHSTEGPGDFAPNEAFLLAHPALARLHRKAAEISPEAADVTSRNLYPPRVEDMACRFNFLHHYAWEESGFPQQWVTRFNEHLQGITCLSRHVQKIMVDNGVTVPMMTSGCGVDHCDRFGVDPEFRIEARAFRFLHVSSCFPRKGADVLLKAYGQAFSADDPVTLVIKTFPNPHNEIRKWLASAQKTTPHYPEVLLIEEDLSDAQLKALYQQCHALVAPSRAEGFGLPMAEAMLCGLPVITTGWGGQLDFCTPDTAWLVDFVFAPAETHFGLFNSVWAEPDVHHLAQIMRDVYALPPEIRREKPNAGRELLLHRFKWTDVAARLVSAARSGSLLSAPPTPRIGWISTWNTQCGIAAYSANLVANLPDEATILAPGEAVAADGANVLRCWKIGEEDTLDGLLQTIEERGIDSVVIQFNYGFFNFAHFSRFLTTLANAGKVVVVMMHATSDPSHVPEKRLVQLAEAFSRCQRVFVHSPNDLNRLKAIGLVDNVAIFPHGVVDHPMTPPAGGAAPFTIASYGFFLPHKGLLELIEALALLLAEGRAVCLKMINAAYPIPESATLIESARKMVEQRGLTHAVQIVADFLPDAESLRLLSTADLIVFPYQETGESSSAAVRYGLATGRAISVTPLAIFDDVSRAVFRLPGKSPADIAQGLAQLMGQMACNDEEIVNKQAEADRWRDAHRYSRLGARLYDILSALARTRESVKKR